jgi:hypothetical protein
MKRFGKQSELHFDEKELKTDLGVNNFIFVGSSCDMFADGIPEEWIIKTLEHCGKYDKNRYLLQTKNPGHPIFQKTNEYVIIQCCVTIETNRETNLNNSPSRHLRLINLAFLDNLMITIEPIMDFDLNIFLKQLQIVAPIQINIGAECFNFIVSCPIVPFYIGG